MREIQQEEELIRWYVVGSTGVNREIKIRDSLRMAGMESYVPMRYEVKRVHDKLQRKALPAVTGLVFVRTSIYRFKEFALTSRDSVFLRRAAWSEHHDFLVVPDREMQVFMELTTTFSENVTYFKPEEVTLHEGELVEITLGSHTYEAEIKRIKGKRSKKLMIEIPGVTTAAITLTPELMKLITHHSENTQERQRQQREKARQEKLEKSGRRDQRRSKNLEMDKKALFATAFHLLFEVPDQYRHEAEYHLAMGELKRIYQRLDGFKGVIPSLEGELALARYLASMKLNIDTEQNTERMQRAIGQLKEVSMLRLRLRFYLATLSGDKNQQKVILNIVKSWNKLHLSPRQLAFLQEVKTVVPDLP